MSTWMTEPSGPYYLTHVDTVRVCASRQEVYDVLNAMTASDRQATTVTVDWRGDDGAYVHEALGWALTATDGES